MPRRALSRFFSTWTARRTAVALAAALVLVPACYAQSGIASSSDATLDLLVGTYTQGRSEGIYVFRFDTRNGALTPLSVAKTVNPSFLVVSRDRHHVYAVNELPGDSGPAAQHGGISAFGFDPASGRLTFEKRVASGGNDPCYLSIAPDARYLLTANYSVAANPGGSFAAFPLAADGTPGSAALTVHHDGGGPVQGRQDNAHVHSTVFSPDGRYLFAQDLGTDRLYAYRYTPDDTVPLTPADPREIALPAGSGPRHLVFAPNGRFAYLTSELAGTVTALRYANGRLTPFQRLPVAAPGFTGKVGAAAIHLSPDGRFLYASNRGDANEITTFAVDAASGRLKPLDRTSTLGKTPREFAIDPGGHWLIVGNQDSDTAYLFRRDVQTGLLEANPARIDIGAPVDFDFVSAQ